VQSTPFAAPLSHCSTPVRTKPSLQTLSLHVVRHVPFGEFAAPASHCSAPSTTPLPHAPEGRHIDQSLKVHASPTGSVAALQLLVRVCGSPVAVGAHSAQVSPEAQSDARAQDAKSRDAVLVSVKDTPVGIQTP
jgi:hypothetical protein